MTATLTPLLALRAHTAADLMSPNPVSIREGATVREAVELLTDRGFGAAPVIDEAGHPVGVLSRGDILVHEREDVPVSIASARVRDLMTPAVFSVGPRAAAAEVVEQMVGLNIHHLFVVENSGVLVGVISSLDVLRALKSIDEE